MTEDEHHLSPAQEERNRRVDLEIENSRAESDPWTSALLAQAREEGRIAGLREAASAMNPMLRSMISRGEAHRTILSLIPAWRRRRGNEPT